jgi:RNase P/RNase MRP subunit p29
MPRKNSALVDISGEVQGETEKAFRFFDGTRIVWLPKSQCEWDVATKTMTMEAWLAIEKELV